MNHRPFEQIIIIGIVTLTLTAISLLMGILIFVITKGAPAMSWEFLASESREFGSRGGILYQTLGTILLMITASLICLPIALGTALFQTEALKSSVLKRCFRFAMLSLNSVPTIIFGLMGYFFLAVYCKMGISWLTGALILAVMILPTVQISIQEAFDALPEPYRESGLALGLNPWQRVRSILLPQCFYGVITGTLLGLARAAGETAAIMFTAAVFSGVKFPQSWSDPVVTLQTHMLALSQEATNPQALTNAWGTGLVLLSIVFALVSGSFFMRLRFW